MKRIVLPLLLCSLFACKKRNVDTFGNVADPNIDAKYAALAPPETTIHIENIHGGFSVFGKSCRYEFSGAFSTLTDSLVINGPVDITVREYLTKSEMIFGNLFPVSDDQPLISGGEVSVTVSQNGQRLKMASGNKFMVMIPTLGANIDTGMRTFQIVQEDFVIRDDRNWQMVPVAYRDWARIAYMGDTLRLLSDHLGYCNADKFMDKPNYQTFKVTPTGISLPDNANMTALAVYDNFKGVWPMYGRNNNTIIETHVPDVPVHFVLIYRTQTDFYAGILGATPVTGGIYAVKLEKMEPAELKRLTDAL